MPQRESKPQDLNQLRKVRREKLKELIDAGENPYEIVTYDQTEHTQQIKDNYAQYEGKEVSIAGRLMAKRVMGKASFANVQDRDGNIQIYVSRDDLGEDYKKFKRLDVGDIVGVKGTVFTTKMGEISVHTKELTLLSKSLQILPEKFHGLTDTDIRYRQRYVDLIMNPEVKTTFIKRSKIISSIRRYLDARDFMEVETPMLVDNAGGASARPFVTHFNALDEDKKLRISLELYLKRLIVGGLERVYEIGRVFRNEGLDMKHNPEFTLMELYQAYTDYNGMMELTEDMYRTVCQEVNGTTKIVYKGNEIDLGKPFAKMTMTEAVKKYSGVDFDQIKTLDEARAVAKEHNVEFEERHKIGDILNLFFDAFVEDKLIQPTFITGHPIEISPLTKKDPEHPGKVLRFEMYVNGWEMCNAYSELNDPIDQRERFKAQEEAFAAGDEEANHTDEDFLNALEIGMPPTGGIGYGIDRMCMLLTGAETIRDVLLFPTMKSGNKSTSEEAKKQQEAWAKKAKPAETAPEHAETSVAAGTDPRDAGTPIDFSKVEIEPLFKEYVDFDTFSKSDFRAVKIKACEAVKKSKKLLKFTLDDGTGEDRIILSGIHAYYEPEQLVGKTAIAIVNLPPRAMMGIDSCGMLLSAVHKEDGEEKLHLLLVDDHIPAGAKLY
ncbi:MAG: lysine--tRNA ligase [Eubacteriales bacterium]|jgi:lysyl-tRNA synthetase class 2|nr:lysine--tRNA ligase [Lachnospiraceae bacterium]MDD5860123.1 lysine--tRNA ligase [Eubacteriales bacterium]MCH4063636.1 lysine--tRNA ligase [Lachnospiraceae bacterium]MCH4103641.1 lysine--tRNA ligase [Lachnospiraceae bacterium]MCI1310107.1 lysine--tRNA ligase [Lachnospiraceae bacterium]